MTNDADTAAARAIYDLATDAAATLLTKLAVELANFDDPVVNKVKAGIILVLEEHVMGPARQRWRDRA